jgi:hypothetical protein
MKNAVYPLSMDKTLHSEVKATARSAGLSQAETMRQAMRFGLRRVKSGLGGPSSKPSLFEALRALGPVKLKGR